MGSSFDMKGIDVSSKPDFQPGWATPIVIRHTRSFLERFLNPRQSRPDCRALVQGRCPGVDQCHDCAWSPLAGD